MPKKQSHTPCRFPEANAALEHRFEFFLVMSIHFVGLFIFSSDSVVDFSSTYLIGFCIFYRI